MRMGEALTGALRGAVECQVMPDLSRRALGRGVAAERIIDSLGLSLLRLSGTMISAASECYGRLDLPNNLVEPHCSLLPLNALQRYLLRGYGQLVGSVVPALVRTPGLGVSPDLPPSHFLVALGRFQEPLP